MSEEPNIPSAGAKKRASAKARREARAQMRQVVFEAMASGFSIEEIADMRKVSSRTIRREVDRTLDERRLDAPDRYIHFQVARLNKAVRVADAGLDRGELRAISPMIKAVKELDRYHGLGALSRAALPAPRTARLPPRPLRLARAAEKEAAKASPGATAAADERDFVTGFSAQSLEIMGSLPKLQPAPEADDGAPSACHPRESGCQEYTADSQHM
jgi:AraC-like DNA-binding protein